MMHYSLTGLVAATHTPFHSNGTLNLDIVEAQAADLIRHNVSAVFIGGTTGECHSLSLAERIALTGRWAQVTRNTALRLVVHVGSNCLSDARELARDAQARGAAAIAALAPSYFKPRDLDALISCAADIAAAAPGTPFYFYDIPALTGVSFPMADFLDRAHDRIPTLAGLKFTNPDLMSFQLCQRVRDGAFDITWGCDEYLLAALALGAKGAVGSTYNFAAPIYHRIIRAFASGDLAAARAEQFRSVRLVQTLAGHGYMAAAKATMAMLGINVGPARLPHGQLDAPTVARLRSDLEALGFFDWIR